MGDRQGLDVRNSEGRVRWQVGPLSADYQGRLHVTLTRADGASVALVVHPAGTEPRALARTPLGDITHGERSGLDGQEAVKLGRAFARNLERAPAGLLRRFPHIAPRLALSRGAEAGLVRGAEREVLFDPPGLAELLAPLLEIDGDPVSGFVLRSIQLPMTTHSADLVGTYLLELSRPDEPGRLVFVEVGVDAWRPFGKVGPLTLGVRPFGRSTSHDEHLDLHLASLLSHLLVHLRGALRGIRLRFPEKLEELRALSVPEERAADIPIGVQTEPGLGDPEPEVMGRSTLNIAVDAECGQACAFCSVKTYLRPSDGGDEELDRLKRELARARARGVRELRLNGIDPTRFSRVLELVESIEAQGFEHMIVFTTARRFADAKFARRFVERAPAALEIFIPLYGTRAEIHDTVTGLAGSFDEVTEAIEVLRGLLERPAAVVLSTIVVEQNVEDLPAMLAHAEQLGVTLHTHLPYPMRQSLLDPYLDCALRESELLGRVLDVDDSASTRRELAHLIPHPCLLLEAERARDLPLLALRDFSAPTRLHGTEYRSTAYTHVGSDPTHDGAFAVATVGCPHASACALAPTCAREQYNVYVQRHGWGEMSPITPQALYAMKPR